MAKAGYVYILTNPSFRKDWVKIVAKLPRIEFLKEMFYEHT